MHREFLSAFEETLKRSEVGKVSVSLSDLPNFDGMHIEKIFEFFKEFELFKEIMKWDDQMSVAYLKMCLRGEAKLTFEEITNSDMNFEQIKRKDDGNLFD